MGQVFLSFSTKQLDVARRIRDSLEDRGVRCFLANDDIAHGKDIVTSIEDALPTSPVLMPLLTPDYKSSTWTQLERSAHMFLEAPDEVREIVPVKFGDFDDKSIPPLLRPLKYYTLSDVKGVDRLADELAPRLLGLLSQSPVPTYEAFAREMGVRELVVVEGATGDALYKSLGKGAASYFERQVLRNFRLGLACANTIYNMVRQVKKFRLRMNAYPISFNLEPEMTNVLSAYAALIELWNKNPECVPHSLPLPPFFTSDEEREVLTSRPDVKTIQAQINDLNMAFYSCGWLGAGSSFDIHQKHVNTYFDAEFTTASLTDLGACGEINLSPYSLQGEQINHPVSRAAEVLPLARIKELARFDDRHMVLVAGGAHKVEPILGALRGGFMNVLVTDQATLDRVINLNRETQSAVPA
ncbi:MAG TPA: sugar-binding domain-containing protein [Solirubrobacterales bacterium]|nr:sugar-binding domain-containing protein [Solirubrobacterales bacterium]